LVPLPRQEASKCVGLWYPLCFPTPSKNDSGQTLKREKLRTKVVFALRRSTADGAFGLKYPFNPGASISATRIVVPPPVSAPGYPHPDTAGTWHRTLVPRTPVTTEANRKPPSRASDGSRTAIARVETSNVVGAPPRPTSVALASYRRAGRTLVPPGPSAEVNGLKLRDAVSSPHSFFTPTPFIQVNLIERAAIFSGLANTFSPIRPSGSPRYARFENLLWDPSPKFHRVVHKLFRTLGPRFSDAGTPGYWLSTGLWYPLLIIDSNILPIAGGSKVRSCFSNTWTT
jgi:hypothetical protein